ncbi:TonB-dependent receptor domain-containing protein [Solilutibacter pythonis]|uniref:TonB-dependent receptor domain-containing protein n=1 Tax=Solilutibacter pythonis TaxID=2483112 RepID=UPI001FEA1B31|nr:TonB-dependent receptor [Lysobacter pythonis]
MTGSRILRAGFDTLEPAQVISREEITQLGITNVAESLFRQPGFSAGASYRGDQSGFGAGVNFISRFGLGSNRELTLVNGRRFVSSNPPTQFGPASGGLQVDLSAIPTALIERVESIGIGGAPTYGSDAITGVTNLILRKDFEGVETTMGFGSTTYGDNIRFNFSSTFGKNFSDNRGNFTITASHDRNNGVLANSREFYRQNIAIVPNPNADMIKKFMPGRDPATDGRLSPGVGFDTSSADGIPGSVYIRNRTLSAITFGGMLLPATGNLIKNGAGQLLGFGPGSDQYFQFNSSGRLATFDPGMPFGTRMQSSGGDGMRLNDTIQLISDLDRSNVFATGRYDFTDSIRAFAELSWFKSKALEIADQSIYNGPYFSNLSLPLTFSIDNPFINPEDRATLAALGVTSFRLSRASRDIVENNSSSTSTIKRIVFGLDGIFDIGSRQAQWEVSINHGRGNFEYGGYALNQQKFINAINVRRDTNGNIVCDSSVTGTVADPACVPLNLFGLNSPSAEAKAYVTTPTLAHAANQQTVFNANMTVGLFDLPGGEFKVNGGYEQRHEKGSFTPDAFQQAGLGRSVPIQAISGSFKTREIFVEALAPIFGGDRSYPGLNRLEVTLKGRRVNNSLAGLFDAYTYGLQYEPFAGLQLRGNKTRSFRAPAIVELFQPVSTAFFSIPEACTPSNIGGGQTPDIRRRNCQAFFAAYPGVDPSTFAANSGTQQGTSGGNLNLRNEQAESWTAGIVFQPTFVKGLTMAVDYYKINMTEAITSLRAAQIVSACFDNPNFNANDPKNGNEFCKMISRDPSTGVANSIRTQRVNGQLLNFKGWTGEVRYSLNLADYGWGEGRINLGFFGYFPKSLQSQVTPVVPPAESIGSYGYSRRQYQWSAGFVGKHWMYGLAANYNSSTILDVQASNLPEQRDIYTRPSFTKWDGYLGYKFNEKVRVNLSIINLRNKIGPYPFVDDSLGRRYMLTSTYKF